MTRLCSLIPLPFLFFAFAHAAQNSQERSGLVIDQNGAAIPRASVSFFIADNGQPGYRTETDENGRFELPTRAGGILIIEAAGFARYVVSLKAGAVKEITVVLVPVSLSEAVTVTGTETNLESSVASVAVLSRRQLDSTAATALDDRLRQIPGFSLFRRAGSRTANPTTQGVSLRGVGASGASRALVLADGIPANDPFGGWIYWGRVPSEAVAQVEVLRGSASDLYGGSAVSGVISLIKRRPVAAPLLVLEASYGSDRAPMLSTYASAGISKWRGSIAGEIFRTGGFVPVDKAARGPVDTPANVRRSVINPFVERIFSGPNRIFTSAEFFQEQRENGTPLQTNDTNLRNFSAGGDRGFPRAGFLTVRAYGGTQAYNQSFSAVSTDRRSESLTRLQRVPSQVLGFGGQWTGTVRRNVFIAGLDLRQVRGRSDETGFAGGRAATLSSAGGHEFTTGVFGGAVIPVASRLVLSAGVRHDRWQNSAGYSATRSLLSGASNAARFSDRSEAAVSPRASLLFRATAHVSLVGTFAAGFRRPTLNELYRSFRVGDVLTLANENLRAERALNTEAAATITGFKGRLYFRSGFYCTGISRPVSNVTLTVTPGLITRQRQNLGQTRACGIETDGQMKLTRELSVSGGYLFVDSRVVSFPMNRALENLRIPQVARNQFTFQFEYSNPKNVRFALQMRGSDSQFDDDQNLFRLSSYFTADAFASRRLTQQLEIFAAAENLFDSEIEAGRTPVLTLASPRTVRIGLRLRLGKK